jgi:hypothetical protein
LKIRPLQPSTVTLDDLVEAVLRECYGEKFGECVNARLRPKADILVVSQIGRKPTATRSNDPAEGLEL